MFTGIIEEVGRLKNLRGGRIKIACSKVLEGVKVGDSIAANGICLTVVEHGTDYFAADVMPETFKKTSLGELKSGGLVNLERALQVGERLGGHIVSGHIDGVGKILSIKSDGNSLLIDVAAPCHLMRQIAPKGSVALDGISLTVVDAGSESFSVSMIPHTRAVTNFQAKRAGSPVNIETDILAKYIERLTNFNAAPTITKSFLEENGFA